MVTLKGDLFQAGMSAFNHNGTGSRFNINMMSTMDWCFGSSRKHHSSICISCAREQDRANSKNSFHFQISTCV